MKYCLLILVLPLFASAQPCRYQLRIFSAFDKTSNVVYATAPALNSPYIFENSTFSQNQTMDIFQPTGDTAQKRALILFAHSGGFLNGTKDNEDMQALCDSFSRRGYVTATINYRLGFNPLSSNASERAVWRGVQDGSAAVRYFKQNAAVYKIDTTRIFIWGSSAGAFLALGLGFIDDAERPASTYSGSLRPDLGCKDCSGNAFAHSSKVTGIISCWGATGDTAWFQNNNNIPVQLFHGSGDATVPFLEGYPFGLSTIAYVRGSYQINEQLNRTSIYHEFYSETGLGHEYWGTSNGTFDPGGPTVYWNDILTKAKNFMLGRMSGLPACVLPVSLLSFTGNNKDESIQLNWSTATEVKLQKFIVERSADGIRYNEVANISAKGINGSGSNYVFTYKAPFAGISYYRLKVLDDDGSFTYSNILSFKTTTRDLVVKIISPNPFYNDVVIEMQSNKDRKVQMQVFDMTGKILLNRSEIIKAGVNNYRLSLSELSPGMYFVQYQSEQEGILLTLKLVKQ